jgi:oligopeptidase A
MTPREEQNPLLDVSSSPRYDAIRAEHGEPAVRLRVKQAEAELERLLAAPGPRTWDGFVRPLDDAEEAVDRAWSALSNLEATLGTDELRAAHRAAQAVVTAHGSKVGQDERLYRAVRDVAEGPAAASLDRAQRKILEDDLRDFRLAGVNLPPEQKERCRAIRTELAQLGSEFADHATDDALAFRLVVDREEDLAGLPPAFVASARARARAEDPKAPAGRAVFGLDQPTVTTFLAQQRNRDLRAIVHRAWVTRASSGERDNAPLAARILRLRKELATLLGFGCYAELSLTKKMARSPAEVRAFLLDLADRAMPKAREELARLQEFARREDGIERLERHDLAYYREHLRQRLHGFSQEDLRAYLPLPRVLDGLGKVLGRLYGIELRDRTADGVLPVWHPDVRVLEVTERGAPVGHVLFDPFTRKGKRAGAWVAGCVTRKRRSDGSVQRPVAHLVCNFPEPSGGRPSLLAHEDVRTLFHEFGHALHHLLSDVDHRQASGISGVPWDGVEFPSQFHENWIWHADALALISGHVDTGEPIPADLQDRLRAARTFCAALDLLRQAELALVDLELHTDFDPSRDDVRTVIESVRRRVAVVPADPEDRFENSFLHVFQGGYAAGYYGYKWAEVLAADAFGRFEEEGVFSERAARDYRAHVLSRGGSEDFLELFRRFRGRAPDSTALLRHAGIS